MLDQTTQPQTENLESDNPRDKVHLKLVYDYCQANPKVCPYVEMTGRLLREHPSDEEQIIHNFIDALAVSNLKMKGIIMNLNLTLAAHEGKGLVIPKNENVVRGKGPLPIKGRQRK